MPEELIIEHCSPTLAGIKTGSLFSVKINDDTNIISDVRYLNNVLKEKGFEKSYCIKDSAEKRI